MSAAGRIPAPTAVCENIKICHNIVTPENKMTFRYK